MAKEGEHEIYDCGKEWHGRTVYVVKADVDVLSVVLHISNGVLAWCDAEHGHCCEGVV